jgi:hypothetical protein
MASRTQIEVYRERIYALAQGPSGPIYTHVLALCMKIDARAKLYLSNDLVNVRTGNLRSSQAPPVLTNPGTRIIAVIQNNAAYAIYVHEGTRPHEIRPNQRKVLTGWQFEGAPVFAKRVHHPGTKARPFLRMAVVEVFAAS